MREELIARLFDAMSHDIGVMAEMGDSESDLWKILIDASEEDLKYYSDAFLQ